MLTETASSTSLSARADFFHEVIEGWLRYPTVTIACGQWADGAISEIVPGGRAHLLPGRYDGCFAGVRELRLDGALHHLHLDLGRVHQACYVVAPSVCLAFKPALEVRLLTTGAGGAPTERWTVAMMPSSPYVGENLDADCVRHFFQQARDDAARAPGLVDIRIDADVRNGPFGPQLLHLIGEVAGCPGAGWDDALRELLPPRVSTQGGDELPPRCLPVLTEALGLRDASLVIFRDRMLVEFQVERIDGIHRYVEDGHVSWQIGNLRDHHCHLALNAVSRVLFSAEPTSCQAGRLNYTVWFLTAGPAGNPWRPDGYFSVVLNRPYRGNEPRTEVIDPMLALYRRFSHETWVDADAAFLDVLEHGLRDGTNPDLPVAPANVNV